jgi:bifunctional UDP-N-acetylglucosamine pyrophosphorylase/glucosamine-1-phosphate N-acetyltransferase
VRVAKGSYIGAGSTISEDTPAGQLTLARARQVSVPGWKPPKKKG